MLLTSFADSLKVPYKKIFPQSEFYWYKARQSESIFVDHVSDFNSIEDLLGKCTKADADFLLLNLKLFCDGMSDFDFLEVGHFHFDLVENIEDLGLIFP